MPTVACFLLGGWPPVGAGETERTNLKIDGDVRLRLESDWDSRRTDGTERDDRTRARVRARVGLTFEPGDYVSIGVRLRSGSDDSQQSPHITIIDFDGNDTGDADFNLDKWYLEARKDSLWGWAGRNGFPFWKQNELFWDDDATVAGLAGGIEIHPGKTGKLSVIAGYFSLPSGAQEFSGNLGAGQIVYSSEAGDVGFVVAGGLYSIAGDRDDPDAAVLLQGNGLRDYEIWAASAQVKLGVGDRPLTLGVDYLHNAQDYSDTDPDPVTAANSDETDGHVLSASYGKLKMKGDWLAAYYYARLEALAVNSSYAQDDWVRWGSAVETRASNMKGHELRFAYAFSKRLNVVARLYLAESITTVEDGNRFRIDWNYKF